MRLAAALAGLTLSLAVVSGDGAKPITGATALAVQSWVQAVKTHEPGRVDEPVITVAALSYEAREELNTGMALFVAALLGRTYDTQGNPAAKLIVDTAHAAGNPTANTFLKQAAVLHSDVAAYGDRNPVLRTGAAQPRTETLEFRTGMGRTTMELDAIPPLLTQNRLVLNQDGQVLGEAVASWNWPFARYLLDLVSAGRALKPPASWAPPGPATDPFLSNWYHATSAYMFASGAYGDLTPHLHHAAGVLPADARMLLDRGCFAELLGLPMHQALLSERDVLAQRTAPRWAELVSPPLRIPSAATTNAEAERLFRRVLAVDPSLVEARVRLARLLDLRKRHEEAAAELQTALAGNPRGVVAFYAHLFAGRVAQALGQVDDASRHYRDALALFPDAQSALLASSQLALLGSDVPATLAPLERLGARSTLFTADPWWQYHLGPGRDADDLLHALWASVPRE